MNKKRALVAVAAIGVVAMLGLSAVPVAAATAPLPEPEQPSATCEWYGEFHWKKLQTYEQFPSIYNPEHGSYAGHTLYEINAVSYPVPWGQECGMRWSAEYDSYRIDRWGTPCGPVALS